MLWGIKRTKWWDGNRGGTLEGAKKRERVKRIGEERGRAKKQTIAINLTAITVSVSLTFLRANYKLQYESHTSFRLQTKHK